DILFNILILFSKIANDHCPSMPCPMKGKAGETEKNMFFFNVLCLFFSGSLCIVICIPNIARHHARRPAVPASQRGENPVMR
ncbi:hypothetical protein, partial [Mailhella massiliensis]